MNRWSQVFSRICLAVVCVSIAASVSEARPEAELAPRNITKMLETEREKHGLPAVAALVIQNDRVVARGASGVRKNGAKTRVKLNDKWHIGSCTKAFTATLIGILVEEGTMEWETTIAEALPDLVDVMRDEYRDITVEQLLSNRGRVTHEWDVPGLWGVLWQREGTPVEERRKMAEAILAQPPKTEPGGYFYSNCGFAIAGHMAETITGTSWEEMTREKIFEPLRMRSAGFGVPWEGEPPSQPWPHNADGSPVTPGPMADNPPSIGPGATIHVSLNDWAAFMIEHLKGARGEDGRLLRAETYARIHKGTLIEQGPDKYALGWMETNRAWAVGDEDGATGRCLTHAGSNNSWYVLAWIVPEKNAAFLAATNIGGDGMYQKIDAVNWAVITDHMDRRER